MLTTRKLEELDRIYKGYYSRDGKCVATFKVIYGFVGDAICRKLSL